LADAKYNELLTFSAAMTRKMSKSEIQDINAENMIKQKADKKKSSRKTLSKDLKKDQLIEALNLKIKEVDDKYLRLSAEFDNYRKRTMKEKADFAKFADEEVMLKLLPVIDDFDRAIQSIENVEDIKFMKDGLILIYNKFSDFLKQNNIQEIEAIHKDFDTDCHEAITKIPAPDKKLKGKVVDVIEKGYTLNGKVIRYSKVVVGE